MSEGILGRAKASAKNIEHYAYDCDFKEARLVILALIAEVEAKNDKIMQDAIPIQMHHNNALTLQKEVERLRSENKIISDRAAHHEKQDAAEIELLAARIKELEALNELNHKNMRSWLDTTTDKEFLDKLSSEIGFKDAYIKRLEAEFLEATKEIVYATHEGRDAPEGEDVYAEKVAREALEQLQAEGKVGGGKTEYGGQHHCGTQISHTGGGEWHCPKCNPLLTAEQREEEGKRDA